MKHCLNQRKKNKEKFTFVTKGYDGPWQGGEVAVTFHFGKRDPETEQRTLSRISLRGDDDLGMEKIGATEDDFNYLKQSFSSSGKSILSADLLRKMGFVYA